MSKTLIEKLNDARRLTSLGSHYDHASYNDALVHAIAIVRHHEAERHNGSASSRDEETLGASTAEIAGESPAAPATTENKGGQSAEEALHIFIHQGENGVWESTGSHFADMKQGFFAGWDARASQQRGYSVMGDASNRKTEDGSSPLHTPPPIHESDCALHNEPAMPIGPCDCSVSRSEIRGVINDAEAVKILSTGYIDDQFESQHNNTGCCIASMEAAWQALKPHLRKPMPVSLAECVKAISKAYDKDASLCLSYPRNEFVALLGDGTAEIAKAVLEAAGVVYED